MAVVTSKSIVLSDATDITEYITSNSKVTIDEEVGTPYATASFSISGFTIPDTFYRSLTNSITITLNSLGRVFYITDIDTSHKNISEVIAKTEGVFMSDAYSHKTASTEIERNRTDLIAKYATDVGITITNTSTQLPFIGYSYEREGTIRDEVTKLCKVTGADLYQIAGDVHISDIKKIVVPEITIPKSRISNIALSLNASGGNAIKSVIINQYHDDIYANNKITLLYDPEESPYTNGVVLFNPIPQSESDFAVSGLNILAVYDTEILFETTLTGESYVELDGGIIDVVSVEVNSESLDYLSGEYEYIDNYNVIYFGTPVTGEVKVSYTTRMYVGDLPVPDKIVQSVTKDITIKYLDQKLNQLVTVTAQANGIGDDGTGAYTTSNGVTIIVPVEMWYDEAFIFYTIGSTYDSLLAPTLLLLDTVTTSIATVGGLSFGGASITIKRKYDSDYSNSYTDLATVTTDDYVYEYSGRVQKIEGLYLLVLDYEKADIGSFVVKQGGAIVNTGDYSHVTTPTNALSFNEAMEGADVTVYYTPKYIRAWTITIPNTLIKTWMITCEDAVVTGEINQDDITPPPTFPMDILIDLTNELGVSTSQVADKEFTGSNDTYYTANSVGVITVTVNVGDDFEIDTSDILEGSYITVTENGC